MNGLLTAASWIIVVLGTLAAVCLLLLLIFWAVAKCWEIWWEYGTIHRYYKAFKQYVYTRSQEEITINEAFNRAKEDSQKGDFWGRYNRARKQIGASITALEDLWQAVEWWRSGDWGKEKVAQELVAYVSSVEEQFPHTSQMAMAYLTWRHYLPGMLARFDTIYGDLARLRKAAQGKREKGYSPEIDAAWESARSGLRYVESALTAALKKADSLNLAESKAGEEQSN